MYGGFQWFLDGIHAILLWYNIGVILWRITISVGVIYFMGFVLSMVFLLVLMLIWLHIFIHVFTCGIVFILRLLMFDIVFILLISILVHSCNLRKLTCSCIFFHNNLQHDWLFYNKKLVWRAVPHQELSGLPHWYVTNDVIGRASHIWIVILRTLQR